MEPFVTCLWFNTEAAEAAAFYTSVFPGSEIVKTTHYGEGASRPAGSVLTVEFVANRQRFVALNGGPEFTFSPAISFQVFCDDGAELDHYWDTLSDGGRLSQCGWLDDRYGLSWQVIPKGVPELLADPDPERAQRAFAAMMTMQKLDLAAMQAAADGQ